MNTEERQALAVETAAEKAREWAALVWNNGDDFDFIDLALAHEMRVAIREEGMSPEMVSWIARNALTRIVDELNLVFPDRPAMDP